MDIGDLNSVCKRVVRRMFAGVAKLHPRGVLCMGGVLYTRKHRKGNVTVKQSTSDISESDMGVLDGIWVKRSRDFCFDGFELTKEAKAILQREAAP